MELSKIANGAEIKDKVLKYVFTLNIDVPHAPLSAVMRNSFRLTVAGASLSFDYLLEKDHDYAGAYYATIVDVKVDAHHGAFA
jgi:hypothetical protein